MERKGTNEIVCFEGKKEGRWIYRKKERRTVGIGMV
jgi:hypothetical protein